MDFIVNWDKAQTLQTPDGVELTSMFTNVLADNGNATVLLPDATKEVSQPYFIKMTSHNSNNCVNVCTNPGQLVEENDSQPILLVGEVFGFISDGSNWWIFSHYKPSV